MLSKIEMARLESIDDLRSIWPNEARNFTPWLAQQENLDILGEAIGMDLTITESEATVGDFSADIVAETAVDGRDRAIVVIENQLEDTNHDHLGKIITYASGLGAKILVWVVSHARSEHRQAVKWLNEHTNSDVYVFLVEIQVLRIGDSKPAVRFDVIEEPNAWERKVRSMSSLSA